MVDNDCKPYGLFHREFGLLSTQNKKNVFYKKNHSYMKVVSKKRSKY